MKDTLIRDADNESYYGAYVESNKCYLSTPLYIFRSYMDYFVIPVDYEFPNSTQYTNFYPWWFLNSGCYCVIVIMPTVLGLALSQLLWNHLPIHSTRRFLMEFVLIALPTICNNTVTSDYNVLYCGIVAILIGFLLWRSGIWKRSAYLALHFNYNVGKRPIVFTLLRATAYIGTSVAILAVDFESFSIDYRKSLNYGATVMDMGIGLFIVTMGMVSRRARKFRDLIQLRKTVLPLLLLGVARTLVVDQLNYYQNVHEYGKHLNAFFTLGLTKLFGSIFSLFARSDQQLLPLSIGILILHEIALQAGISDYVMLFQNREDFISSNREGLFCLPGCAALYLLSSYFGTWYKSKDTLNYKQFFIKLRNMFLMTTAGWLLYLASSYAIGISRVTCNAGYVIWISTICLTLLLIYSFLFEFAMNVPTQQHLQDGYLSIDQVEPDSMALPAFAYSVNMNGLTYFMISNLFTGFVNMTLRPRERSSAETVIILTLYMLSSTGIVYIMFRKGIRIA